MKICRICKQEKTLNSFYINKQNKDGLASCCINCRKEYILSVNYKNKLDRTNGIFYYKVCEKHGPLLPDQIRVTNTIDRGNRVLRLYCFLCVAINKIDQCNEERKLKRIEEGHPLQCTTCKKTKDLSYFNVGEYRIKSPRCKMCQKITALNYENNVSISRKFKLTRKEYQKMWDEQKGLCKICNLPETTFDRGKLRNLSADHCHKIQSETGNTVIRGLLCTQCNNGLGRFMDSSELLRKAADYLDKFNEKT